MGDTLYYYRVAAVSESGEGENESGLGVTVRERQRLRSVPRHPVQTKQSSGG